MEKSSMPVEFRPLEVIAKQVADDETRCWIVCMLDRVRHTLEESHQRYLVWEAREEDVSLEQAFRLFESECLLDELGIDDGFVPPVPIVPLEPFEVRAMAVIGGYRSIAEKLPELWQQRFRQLVERLTQSVAAMLRAEARTRQRVLDIYRALED